jgi:hypothetical protein
MADPNPTPAPAPTPAEPKLTPEQLEEKRIANQDATDIHNIYMISYNNIQYFKKEYLDLERSISSSLGINLASQNENVDFYDKLSQAQKVYNELVNRNPDLRTIMYVSQTSKVQTQELINTENTRRGNILNPPPPPPVATPST